MLSFYPQMLAALYPYPFCFYLLLTRKHSSLFFFFSMRRFIAWPRFGLYCGKWSPISQGKSSNKIALLLRSLSSEKTGILCLLKKGEWKSYFLPLVHLISPSFLWRIQWSVEVEKQTYCILGATRSNFHPRCTFVCRLRKGRSLCHIQKWPENVQIKWVIKSNY